MKATCLKPLCALFRRLGQERRGNFAIITALLLAPLMAAVGFSVDLSHAYSLRASMREAADAAILDALSDSALEQIYKGAAITPEQLKRLAVRAEQNFDDIMPRKALMETGASPSATVSIAGNQINATLTYSGAMRTEFLRLFGFSALGISGKAQSRANLPQFTDVNILIDNSPSMLIAANDAERAKLMRVTGDYARRNNRPMDVNGCAFACHDLDPDPETVMNYYDLARSAGIRLRIDTVKSALLELLDAASSTASQGNQFRYSLYDFGDSMTTIMTNYVMNRLKNETDVAKVKAAVAMEQPMTTPYADFIGKAGSSPEMALEELQLSIPRGGDGTTEASRKQLLIFFTDGVSNSRSVFNCAGQRWPPYGQCTGPFQPAICDQLKRRGIRIAILHTAYLPIPSSPYFIQRVAPVLPQIEPNLRTCASPGLYRNVEYGQPMDDALKSLFQQSLHNVRLTR